MQSFRMLLLAASARYVLLSFVPKRKHRRENEGIKQRNKKETGRKNIVKAFNRRTHSIRDGHVEQYIHHSSKQHRRPIRGARTRMELVRQQSAPSPKRKQLIITANTPNTRTPVILKHHTRITHKDKSTHAQAQCVSYMRFDRPHNKYC